MAKILGFITAALLVVSAFLASKNKERYAQEIENATAAKAKHDSTKKKLAAAIAEKENTLKVRKEIEEENVALESDKANQERVNAELKTQSEAKTAEVDSNKQKIDEIKEKTKAMGDLSTLASKMKETNEEIVTLRTDIEQAESKLASLTAQTRAAQTSVGDLNTKITALTRGRSLPTLRTTIRSVYPAYGFVTLGAGNNAGVVNNSTLNVVRDGNTVGKLLVTAVESNRASANIVPDSLAEDVTFRSGDRVVAEEAPPAPSPQPPADTPADSAPTPPTDPAPADSAPTPPADEVGQDPFAAPAPPSTPAAESADPFSN